MNSTQTFKNVESFLFSITGITAIITLAGPVGIREWSASLLLSCLVAQFIYTSVQRELAPELRKGNRRYLPFLNTLILSFYFMVIILSLNLFVRKQSFHFVLSILISMLIDSCIYYLFLALLLSLLRRSISARTCALLWLLPTTLTFFHFYGIMRRTPLYVISIPSSLAKTLCTIWLTGFATILLWKVLSHLQFRHFVLKDATPVEEPEILALWQQVCKEANMECIPLLFRSPNVKTPLSMGFFFRDIRVVLPQLHYSPDDLSLILRHELVHIMRFDSGNKFFLTFCSALGWFNPLMWLAMRSSADDLELNCDETVLMGADEGQRQQYASLLLHTAGNQRGFTTCLSTSASALRYRLRSVVTPSRRFVGGLLAGAMTLVLFVISGYVTLSYQQGSGQELIFPLDSEECQVSHVLDLRFNQRYAHADSQAILDYLAQLPLEQIVDSYSMKPAGCSYEVGSEYLEFFISGSDEDLLLTLSPLGLTVVERYSSRFDLQATYLVQENCGLGLSGVPAGD